MALLLFMIVCGLELHNNNYNFENDADFARHLAKGAGDILLNLYSNFSLNGEELGQIGDKQANDFIINEIKKYRPNDGILSEESIDDLARLNKSRVWIIDPLDGTREFCERNDEWAVHIGLAIEKKPLLGVVNMPQKKQLFESVKPIKLPPLNSTTKIFVSRSRPCDEASLLAQKFNGELVSMGSAGAKTMAILNGEGEIYVHVGGQNEWDNCAPIAIALENGLHASRIDGSEISYNNKNTIVSDLLICRKELAQIALNILNE